MVWCRHEMSTRVDQGVYAHAGALMKMILGADLSYVNEVEALGGVFYDQGQARDPFRILKDHGANLVRVRLWHTPTWTSYSTLADAQRTIRRARALDMAVLLNLHYSDTWADPAKQIVPAAWAALSDIDQLERAVYDYTYTVLDELNAQGLMPDYVQVGNEINTEIMVGAPHNGASINWPRNARLINAGISAVRVAGRVAGQQTATSPRIILHIAQPENVVPWFDAALAAGVHDFDVIGISYYPKWSTSSMEQAGQTIDQARRRYQTEVMIVETAYPWTLAAGQTDDHLLGPDSVLPAYAPTPQGQRDFLIDLTQTVLDAGGTGVIYWEPAWISTPDRPSTWENATFFDEQHHVHAGIEFLSHSYTKRARECR